jgi:hypothetical protein
MKSKNPEALLPGEELVEEGLADLAENRMSEAALLVLVASPRLKRLGLKIPVVDLPQPWEHRLYELLEDRLGTGAHSHYNSLIRRIVSYSQALERERPSEPK